MNLNKKRKDIKDDEVNINKRHKIVYDEVTFIRGKQNIDDTIENSTIMDIDDNDILFGNKNNIRKQHQKK